MNLLVTLAFLFSIVALVYAVRAERRLRTVLSVLESKNTCTVTIDHTDGRVTVLQREVK